MYRRVVGLVVGVLVASFCGCHSTHTPSQLGAGSACTVFPGPVQTPGYMLNDADLNGDGRADMLTTGGSGSVAVYLGNGDGTFEHQQDLLDGHGTILTVGDFDGDGAPDLVSLTSGFHDGATHYALRISKAGAFDVAVDGPSVAGPAFPMETFFNFVLGDFNGDHHLDVALGGGFVDTADNIDSSISVFLGNGDLTFQPQQVVASGSSLTPVDWSGVDAADLNGDGLTDLVGWSGTSDGDATVWLAQAGGGFGAPTMITSPGGASRLADVNGDSKLDIVAGAGGIALGNGDGTFQAPIPFAGGDAIALADVDGDGKLDVASSVHDTGVIMVARGNGDGTFQPGVGYDFRASGPLTFLDVDGDGRPELLHGIDLVHNRGDGTFVGWRDYMMAADPIGGVITIASGDLDRDGNTDLAVTADGNVHILLGTGQSELRLVFDLVPAGPTSQVAIGDVDGDGSKDIVSLGAAWLNDGSGHFGAPVTFSAPSGTWAVADLDGDGRIDMVVAEKTQISVLRGYGDGTFAPVHHYARPDCMMRDQMSLAIADVDRDGKPDLVTSDCMTTSLWRGQGGDAFASGVQIAAPSLRIAIGDLDGDARPDIALDGEVLFANGAGGWSPVSIAGVRGLSIADFDGDGRLDLSIGDGTVLTYDGGAFRTIVHLALPGPVAAAFLVDLDGDGKAEMLSRSAGLLDVLANECHVTATARTCNQPSDCPGFDTQCSVRGCSDHVCARDYAAAGTVLTQQTPGDCRTAVCDGNGAQASQASNDPPPNTDPCMSVACSNGGVVTSAVPDGTSCGSNGAVCGGGQCAPPDLVVTFAPSNSTAVQELQFADVRLLDENMNEVGRCHGDDLTPCTFPITSVGHMYTLDVSSPWTVSISGDCTPAMWSSYCQFQAGVRKQIYVGLYNDAANRWTFEGNLGESFVAAAHDSLGELVAGSDQRLVKLDATGALVWQVVIPANSVATDASNAIYVLSGDQLIKLDSAGTQLWQHTAFACPAADYMRCLVVAPNGDVIVGGAQVQRWSPAGTLLWSVPHQASWTHSEVVSLPTDVTLILQDDSASGGVIAARFASDGTRLSDLVDSAAGALGTASSTLAIDAAGHVVVASVVGTNAQIRVYDSTGAAVHSWDTSMNFGQPATTGPVGVVTTPWGSTDLAFPLGSSAGYGWFAIQFGATYDYLSATEAEGQTWPGLDGPLGVVTHNACGAPDGHAAFVGAYHAIDQQTFGWIHGLAMAPCCANPP